MVHASRGRLRSRLAHLRSEVAIVTGLGERCSATDTSAGAAMARGLLGDPRPHRARRAGLPRLRRPGRRARRLHAAAPAARPPRFPDRHRQGPLHGQSAERHRRCPPATCCCRRSARTTSSTPPSTASTTAIAASTAAAASSSSARTTCASCGLADGDLVDLVSVWSDGERRAPGFRLVDYPTPEGCAAAYFPESERAGPAGLDRRDQQHPDVEVRGDPPGEAGQSLIPQEAIALTWPFPSGIPPARGGIRLSRHDRASAVALGRNADYLRYHSIINDAISG